MDRRQSMTRKQVNTYAYREARLAGLAVSTSRDVADRVLERVFLGGETLKLAVKDEINKFGHWVVRRFASDDLLARFKTRDEAEAFVERRMDAEGGIYMIEED